MTDRVQQDERQRTDRPVCPVLEEDVFGERALAEAAFVSPVRQYDVRAPGAKRPYEDQVGSEWFLRYKW